MSTEIIILGCGDSMGTPRAGNDWGKCDPTNTKNARTRPSIWIKSETTSIIVDTGPDFRAQTVRENIKNIDAILYTHAHADHVSGLDDIRPYFFRRDKKRIPIYLDQASFHEMKARFRYIFEGGGDIYPPLVDANIWNEHDFFAPQKIGDIEFIPYKQQHGDIESIGFRCGNVAYSTDMVNLPDASIDVIKNVPVWIVDGANWHWDKLISHCNLDRIYELQTRIQAQKIYLTHLKNDTDYDHLRSILPDFIEPAFDGLRLSC